MFHFSSIKTHQCQQVCRRSDSLLAPNSEMRNALKCNTLSNNGLHFSLKMIFT